MKGYLWYHPKYFVQFLPILLVKRDEIFQIIGRHSGETVTLRKYVVDYEQMRKWIFEFLSKFQGRDIKIDT